MLGQTWLPQPGEQQQHVGRGLWCWCAASLLSHVGNGAAEGPVGPLPVGPEAWELVEEAMDPP